MHELGIKRQSGRVNVEGVVLRHDTEYISNTFELPVLIEDRQTLSHRASRTHALLFISCHQFIYLFSFSFQYYPVKSNFSEDSLG